MKKDKPFTEAKKPLDYLDADFLRTAQQMAELTRPLAEEQERLQELFKPTQMAIKSWGANMHGISAMTSAMAAQWQGSIASFQPIMTHPALTAMNIPDMQTAQAVANLGAAGFLATGGYLEQAGALARGSLYASVAPMQASIQKIFSGINVQAAFSSSVTDYVASIFSANYAVPKFASIVQELQAGATSITETAQVLQTAIQGIKLASFDAEFKAQRQMPSPVRYMPERANYQTSLPFRWTAFIKNTHDEFDELASGDKKQAKWFHSLINKADDFFHNRNVDFKTPAEVIFVLFILTSFIIVWMQLGYFPNISDVALNIRDFFIDRLNDFRELLFHLFLLKIYDKLKN